ncbi:MAG: TRZ/ATZ family hydrolase [Pseudomonadota bacterium]
MSSQSKQQVDTLIHAGWIVPVIPHGQVFRNYSIALQDGRISALMPSSAAADVTASEVVELPNHVIAPGLINCHGHAAMTLLRGYADDLPLIPWLEEHMWPAEGQFVNEAFIEDGTAIAVAEMIRAGTTTYSDMYFFPEIASAAAQRIGMRCQITFPIFDFPTAWGSGPDEYIRKGLALRDTCKHNDLVHVVFGPHAPYTVSPEHLRKVATLAAELDTAIHIHLHETQGEVQRAIAEHGQRPIASLHDMGLLGPRTQCVHMTDLIEEDIALLAETGSHVIHCPQSNMKLASGICPIRDLQLAGVNVALGTDSAASNNDLNLFGEMQTAALLAKVHSMDATVLPAADALAMATINGAIAMGLQDQLGSLEVGKQGDLIAVDLSAPETQPLYHPLSQLVYSCNGSQVTHSWVAGQAIMTERQLVHADTDRLVASAQDWQRRIAAGAAK